VKGIEIQGPIEGEAGRYTVTIVSPWGERQIDCPSRRAGEMARDAAAAVLDLVSARRGRITGISGPYLDRQVGRWIVRWVEDGEQRAANRATREEASALHRELSGATLQLPPLDRFGGPRFFERAIGDVLEAAHAATNNGDIGSLKAIREYHRLLDDAAQAWLPYSRFAVVLDELEALVSYMEETGHADAIASLRAEVADGQVIAHTLRSPDLVESDAEPAQAPPCDPEVQQ